MVYNAVSSRFRHTNTHMRKEILLAIVVGILVGLAITFGIYTVRQQLFRNQTPAAIEESRSAGVATPMPATTSILTLQKPEQDFLTAENSVQVVGRALPESYIVILTNETEYITSADKDGDFSQEVELEAGGNKITIVSIASTGEQEAISRNVVYSTVDLDAPATTSAVPSESETAADNTATES